MGGSGIIKLPYGMGDGLIAGSGTFLDSNRPWCIRHSELWQLLLVAAMIASAIELYNKSTLGVFINDQGDLVQRT